MGSIFLSHNSADKPFVRKLAADLRRNGFYAWVDEAEIKLGDSLIEKIEEGIETTDFLGVVLSRNSINSEWVKRGSCCTYPRNSWEEGQSTAYSTRTS